MPTIAEAVSTLEAQLFDGREGERAAFGAWLGAETVLPDILNVSGGVGKSMLLRAFARLTEAVGRPVVLVDARDFPHTPRDFLSALALAATDDPVGYLNAVCPLILLDTAEDLGELSRYLQAELLPRLDTRVKVVVAGRNPLQRLWNEDSPCRRLVRPLPLDQITAAESRDYLQRRGLRGARLVEQVARAAGGSPLALALAADRALQHGMRDCYPSPGPELGCCRGHRRVGSGPGSDWGAEANPWRRRLYQRARLARHEQRLGLDLAAIDGSEAFGGERIGVDLVAHA